MTKRKAMLGGLVAITAISSGVNSFNSKAVNLNTNLNDIELENVTKSVDSKASINENLNLRVNPSIEDDNIILTMKKGSTINIISNDGEWSKVKYGNKEGYALSKYITEFTVNAKTDVVKKVKVNAYALNIRAGASTKYKIIGTLKKDTVLEVYGFNSSWAKIKYNGKDGYVSTKYLDNIVEESNNSNQKMEVVNTSSLNIRKGPGNNYSIKGRLSKGAQIEVISIINGWAKFTYKNSDAYVSSKYLKNIESSTDTSVDTSVIIEKDMYVLVSNTSVRSGEGSNYSILGSLKNGESVYVNKQLSSGWSQVTYKNKTAYVLTKDLTDKLNTSVEEPTQGVSLEAYKQEVLRLINVERAKEGLCALSMDSSLSNVAQLKSQDMIDNNYFAHNSPVYGTPFEMMKLHGITYRVAGENIAMGHSTPQEVVDGWMNSEGHRKNILNSRFTNLGMGIAQANSGRIYWTQMFTGQK